MLDTVISYSPKPIEDFPWIAASRLVGNNPLAWNLAWISYDNMAVPHKDPAFAVAVYHTANAFLATGRADLTAQLPDNASVRGKLRAPPPAFMHWLSHFEHATRLPMFEQYGPTWLMTVQRRCKSWTDHTVRVPAHTPDAATERVYRELLSRV